MRLFMLLALLFLLNACALMPEETGRAELLTMANLQNSFASDGLTEHIVHTWPKDKWWQELHDVGLNRLVEKALADNPGLRAARARLGQAQALSDLQAAEMLPTINANVDLHYRRFSANDFYGPNGGKGFSGAYIDPVVFNYHLDLWGKDQAALEAALGKERAQAAQLAMARLLLSTSIARSYVQLCTNEEDLGLINEQVKQQKAIAQLAQVRWEHGLIAQDEVFNSMQQAEAAQQQAETAVNMVQKLRHQLASLAGQSPGFGNGIICAGHSLVTYLPEPQYLALGLLSHRPDVAAALWQVEAAAQSIKVAKTNFYPDVNLVGFAGLRSLNLKDLFLSNGTSVAYGMGPTLSLPIFEGGRLQAELKHQQSAYDAAVENYNQTLLQAMQQVADSLAEWQQSEAHDHAQERALLAATAEAGLAHKRYQAGLSSIDGMLIAKSALLQQQLTASKLHNAHLHAAITLIEALGGGYENATLSNTQQSN